MVRVGHRSRSAQPADLEDVAVGVSMRNYARTLETLPADVAERSVTKSRSRAASWR